jgi:hypothetical protein
MRAPSSRAPSLALAGLAVAAAALIPSLLFSGELMLENLFFPLFLMACLAIAPALEEPTLARQGFAVGAIALATATRVQGLLLFAVLVGLSAVAASWEPQGLKERYTFYVAPLLLLALVVWIERGAVARWWAAVVLAALVCALPLGRLFREPSLLGNAWGLLPFERAGLTAARILVVDAVGAVGACALFLFAPRLALAGVALFLAASTLVVYSTIRNQSRAVLALSGLQDKTWLGAGPAVYLNATNFEQEARIGHSFEEWVPAWHTRFVPAGGPLTRQGRLALWDVSQPLRFVAVTEGVFADATTTGVAAYSRWSGSGHVAVTTSAPARITLGRFAPLPDGGGRVVGGTTTTASTVTLSTPPAPFRVEVRAPAGTHVTFGFAA